MAPVPTVPASSSPLSWTWQSKDSFNPTRFHLRDDHHIVCDDCASPTGDDVLWCMHIELLTIENGDADWIWSWAPTFEVMIPMFPTSGLWVRASLRLVEKYDACVVSIETDESTEHIRMGFLHEGEGRNVIRQMILDWFDGQFGASTDLKCMSASHKLSSEVVWGDAMRDANKRILNFWSVWDTHTCVYCRNGEGDISDLIPDASSTRRPVF